MANRMDDRRLTLLAGILLVLAGIGVTGVLHDSAVAGVLVLVGGALVLYAFGGRAIESVGPSGVKFRDVKERVAEHVEAYAGLATGKGEAAGPVVQSRAAQAAAAVRAAETPEQLADAILKLTEPETDRERRERVHKDDEARAQPYHGNRTIGR